MTHRGTRIALTGALVLVVLALAGLIPSAQADTERILTISNEDSDPQNPFKAFDGNPPKVYDINGDGTLEIIAQNDNQWVYVFDSQSGEILFETKTHFPPGWGARSFNGPEVSILEEDGNVHLVLANSAAIITSYRFDPSSSTNKNFDFEKEWDRRLDDCHDNPGMDAKPVLWDLDGDGVMEIVAATEEQGVYALHHDGSLAWKHCIAGGNAAPAIGDLDQDDQPDVVHVADNGLVAAFNGQSGAWLWSYNVLDDFDLGSGSIPVRPAVTQLDGQGGNDVVFGARDSHNPDDWDDNHAALVAVDSNGELLWGHQHPDANPLTYTRPIVVDADGDGEKEIYWADWNTNGHKPPWNEDDRWERLGPANFYRYSLDGQVEWHQTLDTWWSNNDLALADADGDGNQEVFANGPEGGEDGIWYLDAATGAKETFVSVHPYKVQRAPVLADLADTGTMQWVVQAAPDADGAGGHAILVYDTGEPYDAAWPHIPYPTVDGDTRDGEGRSGDPSGDTFQATFKINNPNEWWQEVYIDPDTQRTIDDVQVRIDRGSWQGMTERPDWGAWTSSYHAPEGTAVEFLATDTSRATSQSEPFTWMSGEEEKRSTSPTGFDPSFRVSDNINEWWVEVWVDADTSLASVEAQINDGSWTHLEHTDWGAWAKSMHAPQGSQVTFRATSDAGDQATSRTYTWMSDPDAGFQATFDPRAQGNDWWVEVAVDANEPIDTVQAQINQDPWEDLHRTDWGTWAKSLHAPDGSEVTFRAHSEDGDTQTSDTYRWD